MIAKKIKKKSSKAHKSIAWVFIAPGMLVQFVFMWIPIGIAFMLAFQKFYLGKTLYVGWDNFKYFLPANNPLTLLVLKNTFCYALMSIALTFLVPIFVAILLMEMKKSVIRVMMILWFIPVASMAGIIIWLWLYNVQYGLLNGILAILGLPQLRWLDDPHLAMLCLVLPGLVMYGPGLIYIATLQGIPEELYEAAELEGASFWQKIWNVTLPRLRPIIAMMLILAVIRSLQVFEQPFIMTHGGPSMATYTAVMYLFDLAFGGMNYGRATALSIILFFIIMTLITIQRKYFKENLDI